MPGPLPISAKSKRSELREGYAPGEVDAQAICSHSRGAEHRLAGTPPMTSGACAPMRRITSAPRCSGGMAPACSPRHLRTHQRVWWPSALRASAIHTRGTATRRYRPTLTTVPAACSNVRPALGSGCPEPRGKHSRRTATAVPQGAAISHRLRAPGHRWRLRTPRARSPHQSPGPPCSSRLSPIRTRSRPRRPSDSTPTKSPRTKFEIRRQVRRSARP